MSQSDKLCLEFKTGIGFEVAKHLLEKNARVIIACSESSPKCREQVSVLPNQKNLDFRQVDLSRFANVSDFAAQITTKYDHVDCLVNNAAKFTSYRETEDKLKEVVQINSFSPLLLSIKLLPALRKAANPQILNIGCQCHLLSSKWTHNYMTNETRSSLKDTYFLSKNYLLIVTNKLAKLLKDLGVRVNYIEIGHARTSFYDSCFFHKMIILPFYLMVFSSAEQAAAPIIHALCSKKDKFATDTYFLNCEANEMPEDIIKNRVLVESTWSSLLTKLDIKPSDIVQTKQQN
ncbi:MAG: hypothetical protein MHMPM18_002028 [Marteilia pararefringens]